MMIYVSWQGYKNKDPDPKDDKIQICYTMFLNHFLTPHIETIFNFYKFTLIVPFIS